MDFRPRKSAFNATRAAFLAMWGITGPLDFFPGKTSFGQIEEIEEGFFTRPLPWEKVVAQFEHRAGLRVGQELRGRIVETVANLESVSVYKLTDLLACFTGQG